MMGMDKELSIAKKSPATTTEKQDLLLMWKRFDQLTGAAAGGSCCHRD